MTISKMLVVVGLVGCGGVYGDGHAESSARTTGAFTAVEADTALDVVVTRGDEISVVVTTDDNLLDLVTTEVVGGTLRIKQSADIHPTHGTVTIVAPDLVAADANGSGAMTVSGFTEPTMHLGNDGSGRLVASIAAGALDVTAPGSGNVRIDGSADALTLTLDGSGDVDTTQLATHGGSVRSDGSGTASVVLTGDSKLATLGSGSIVARLDQGTTSLTVAGSGDIRWSGDAQVVSQIRTGSGDIVHAQ